MEMRGRWDDRWGTIPDYTTGESGDYQKISTTLFVVGPHLLAFIHSLGRTSRHNVLPIALHIMLQTYIILLLYLTLVLLPLYPTYFYTLSIENTNTNHTKSSTQKHASIPPRRTFIFGQTSITPATTNPSAAGRREHGELGRSSSNAKRLQRRRRGTPSTILPHRLTAPYQQRRRRRRGQRRSRATRSPAPTHSQWTSSPRHDRQLQHHGKFPLPAHSLPLHGNFPRIPEVLESSLVQSLSAEISPTGCARDFCMGDEDPLLRGGCGAEREKWFLYYYYYDGVGRGYLADLSTVHGTGVRRWGGGYEASGGY